MNKNEKFGVSLELIVDKFKQKANNLKQFTKSWADGIKKDLTTSPSIDSIEYTSQISKVENQLDTLEQEYEILKHSKPYQGQTEDLIKYEAEIENARNKIIQLKQKQTDTNYGNVSNSHNSFFSKSSKGYDNLISKVSRYALSIISLRSAYALMSRASSSYLSVDEVRSQKLSNSWATLGAVMVPVIDMITNALQKAIAYINVFIKALTGVDYVAKASAQYVSNTAKSVDKLKGSISGFDEINDISQQNSSSQGNSSNPFSWINDVELDENIIDWLQRMATWLKENWSWIKKVGEVLAITFAVSKIAGYVGNISSLTSCLGKGGLWGALNRISIIGGLAVIGTVAVNIVNDLHSMANDMSTIAERSDKMISKTIKSTTDQNRLLDEMNVKSTAQNKLLELRKSWLRDILGLNESNLTNATATAIKSQEYLDRLIKIEDVENQSNEEQEKILGTLIKQYDANNNVLEQLNKESDEYKTITGINDNYFLQIKDRIKKLQEEGYSYDEINKKLNLAEGTVENLVNIANQDATIDVKADTSSAKKTMTNFFKKMGTSLFTSMFPGLGSLTSVISKIASLDVGTNYVPSDQLAVIHQGEAVIPKKFNSKEYFNGNQEEVSKKLDILIDTIERKDMNAYISKDEVGKASVDYINSKKRTLGKGVI